MANALAPTSLGDASVEATATARAASATSLLRLRGARISFPICVGSLSVFKGIRPGTKNTHEWRCYVRPVDQNHATTDNTDSHNSQRSEANAPPSLSVVISKVVFILDKSFGAHSTEVCERPPFEVVREGWGATYVNIEVFVRGEPTAPVRLRCFVRLRPPARAPPAALLTLSQASEALPMAWGPACGADAAAMTAARYVARKASGALGAMRGASLWPTSAAAKAAAKKAATPAANASKTAAVESTTGVEKAVAAAVDADTQHTAAAVAAQPPRLIVEEMSDAIVVSNPTKETFDAWQAFSGGSSGAAPPATSKAGRARAKHANDPGRSTPPPAECTDMSPALRKLLVASLAVPVPGHPPPLRLTPATADVLAVLALAELSLEAESAQLEAELAALQAQVEATTAEATEILAAARDRVLGAKPGDRKRRREGSED